VASDLFSPSAQEAITRLVVVVPQRPRHGADSEDSEDEDSEDEDEEGMPLPWQVGPLGTGGEAVMPGGYA
jgi:hypothetical protein